MSNLNELIFLKQSDTIEEAGTVGKKGTKKCGKINKENTCIGVPF